MPVAKEQIRQIIADNNLSGVGDVYVLLRDSFKDILQELMEAELDASLGYEKNHKGDLKTSNKRNGHSQKTLKSQYGEFQIDVPRDRDGEFEPKLIPKYQRDISGIEEKVLSLYARGMSTRDIHDQIQELYGMELSAEMVSRITDRILPEVREWQSRPLNPVYPFVFMDCIHYKVRENGRIISRAAYIVLSITAEGYKDILSITVGANETSKFWLGIYCIFYFCIHRCSHNLLLCLHRKCKSHSPKRYMTSKLLYLEIPAESIGILNPAYSPIDAWALTDFISLHISTRQTQTRKLCHTFLHSANFNAYTT